MEKFIKTTDLLVAISSLHSMLDYALHRHNLRVAYIADLLGSRISYSNEFLRNLIIASLFHDIGILFFKTKEQAKLLLKETEQAKDCLVHVHAKIGFELFKNYPFFSKVSRIILHHHRTFKEYKANPGEIPFSSQIVFFADRVDTFMVSQIKLGKSPLAALEALREKLLTDKKELFHPKLVKIFMNHLFNREAFWFELYVEPSYLKETVTELLKKFSILITRREFLKIIELFGYIIDFKSRFTATHSSGVAQVAVQLALYMSFSQDEVKKMRIAGLLHDIGKVAIPSEILEKPGRLTEEEYNLMKSHVFHTYKILSQFIDDDNIVEWASYHHEKLTGNGYPFKLKAPALSRGARIMAVADIFTALTEERPYKKGLSPEESFRIIKSMTEKGELDREVVKTLEKNLTSINKARMIAQKRAMKVYKSLKHIVVKELPFD